MHGPRAFQDFSELSINLTGGDGIHGSRLFQRSASDSTQLRDIRREGWTEVERPLQTGTEGVEGERMREQRGQEMRVR